MCIYIRDIIQKFNISIEDAVSFLRINSFISPYTKVDVNYKIDELQYRAFLTFFSRYQVKIKTNTTQVQQVRTYLHSDFKSHSFKMDIPIESLIFEKGCISIKFANRHYTCKCVDSKISDVLKNHIAEIKEIYNIFNIDVFGSGFGSFFKFRKKAQLRLLEKLSEKYEKRERNGRKARTAINGTRTYIEKNQHEDNEKKTIFTQSCVPQNIAFYDGYYLVWVIDKKGKRLTSIKPLHITDKRSLSVYNRWTTYFASRMSSDIIISYNKQKVLSIKGYKLSDFINLLANPQAELTTEEFLKFLSDTKISLEQCREKSNDIENFIIEYDSAYLDYLSNKQNKRKILKAYEVISTTGEDVFFFSIDIDNEKEVIILENTEPSRASEVFIIYKKDYEVALTTIFNYFTNYEMDKKRELFRRHKFPPEIFHAISYKAIDHNKQQWFSDINKYIYSRHVRVVSTHLNFKAGLHINDSEEENRIYEDKSVVVNHIHSQIMRTLYTRLVAEYGEENVGTEINIGGKRIDLVVRTQKDVYDLYEIKTQSTARICIREALGQIIDYAYFENKDDVRHLYIVGPNETNQKEREYIQSIKDFSPIPISYICELS